MNGSRQLRSLGLLLRAVGCAALASASAIGCMAPADSPDPAGEADVGREDARDDDRGGELPQARSGELALGGQLAFRIAQVFDETDTLIGYSYNEPADGGTLQRWVISTSAAWQELVIKKYDANRDLVAMPGILEHDLAGWSQLVAAQWGAFPITPTYAVCASSIYEQGGVYNDVSWDAIPPGFPQPKLPAFTTLMGWQMFGPQDLIGVTPVPPPSTGSPWPPGPGDVAWTHRNVLRQLYPGDGKAFQYAQLGGDQMGPVDELDVGMFYSKGSVLDSANAEYFYMTPEYAPAGTGVTPTALRPGGVEPPVGSDSEFAEAALWMRVIPGCRDGLRALAETGVRLGVVSSVRSRPFTSCVCSL